MSIYVHTVRAEGKSLKPWVAVITGLSEKFSFERSFIKFRRNWRYAHLSRTNRITDLEYSFFLDQGSVCEFFEHPKEFGKAHRYFARVRSNGLSKMTKEEVLTWLESQPNN